MFRKPVAINPHKLSAPMGATLAFLGIKGCMPLMHGAQGCASFTKVFFTRHFHDPIAIQTTAVNDLTAVFDGGEYGITTAIENITAKVTPSLIGLYSTGLTETKGDDLRSASSKITLPIVYVHTPDFEGGIEQGWAKSINAIIEQLIVAQDTIDCYKVCLIPHVSMTPIEVEKVKEFIELFGFNVYALPDLSMSLDGFLGEKQGQLSSGGISLDEIYALSQCCCVITIGASVQECGNNFVMKCPKSQHFALESVAGLQATDHLVEILISLNKGSVPEKVKRHRARLQDAMLDTHFLLGKGRILIALEHDQSLGITALVKSCGGKIVKIVVGYLAYNQKGHSSDILCEGDLDDMEQFMDECDVVVTNFHAERLCRRHHKALMRRGYPNFEEIGSTHRCDLLYEGGCRFLFDLANLLEEHFNEGVHQ